MEDGRTDAERSRDGCLEAIPGQDFETQRSLWRAALRYNERCKGAATASGGTHGRRLTLGQTEGSLMEREI